MSMYDFALQNLRKKINSLEKHEYFRKKFLHFIRFATVTFIIIVSIYSIYLLSAKNLSFFNYGLAWWIAIFLLISGWIGEFIIVLRGTKLYHEYLDSIQNFSNVLFTTYNESNIHKIEPFIEEERNPEYLKLFKLGFYDYAKEIQEYYLTHIEIYYFDIENIHGISDLLNTTDISKCIGQQLSEQLDTFYVGCINLPDGSNNFFKKCIVVYTSKEPI
ncbi:hypothetical protein [Candidatus Enterococcus mansonii]|uniref:Uncharacterized protein n=1 Tax=Candidatus Enterococcus mansonii TaxID=1834181 RepID=A0A242CFV0_9ENTE|nr:hypothetical protein [Enterococcus sp. 4G2_DIV0659]OTO08800.1 hypothetical protein A5880_001800 [Enterococcus sp. 4G2_DIV0659]